MISEVINCMEQSPSWEANSLWDSKEIMKPKGSLPCSQWPANSETLCNISLKKPLFRFYCEELLAPRQTPKFEDHLLSTVHNCSFNPFAATFFHPQPEDAPCHGDRGPQNVEKVGRYSQCYCACSWEAWERVQVLRNAAKQLVSANVKNLFHFIIGKSEPELTKLCNGFHRANSISPWDLWRIREVPGWKLDRNIDYPNLGVS
jgi:hypothetical protein